MGRCAVESVTVLRGEPPQAASFSGSGDGSGYGDGSGDGDGSGYGYGYGSKQYWRATIKYFAEKWSEAQQSRLQALQNTGAMIAFWRSDQDGRACNGGRNAPVKPGTIEKSPGPLVCCTSGVL